MSESTSRKSCANATAKPRATCVRRAPCCGGASCGADAALAERQRHHVQSLRRRRNRRACRKTAVLASLGCGNPTALAELKQGETVLDLGSGGGIDVLLSARRVGPTGKAYGLDMTDEMLALARENQRKAGREERRVPQGRDRAYPAARQLGRRHHLQLRHQPVGRQGPRAARGVPRAEARRTLRRLRRRHARRRSPSRSAATCCSGSAASPARSTRTTTASSSPPPDSRRSAIEPTRVYKVDDARDFLTGKGIDVDAIAPQVDGKFMSAFVRARKPGQSLTQTEGACCAPACCAT